MCTIYIEDQENFNTEGPATVRMVSNNGPPLPMPMQVPPGHMVQQIIDENGILTNVILSSQPPGLGGPPFMVGYYGNPSTAPHNLNPQFAPAPYNPYSFQYPMHHHHHHHVHPDMLPPRLCNGNNGAGSPPNLLHHCNQQLLLAPPPPPSLSSSTSSLPALSPHSNGFYPQNVFPPPTPAPPPPQQQQPPPPSSSFYNNNNNNNNNNHNNHYHSNYMLDDNRFSGRGFKSRPLLNHRSYAKYNKLNSHHHPHHFNNVFNNNNVNNNNSNGNSYINNNNNNITGYNGNNINNNNNNNITRSEHQLHFAPLPSQPPPPTSYLHGNQHHYPNSPPPHHHHPLPPPPPHHHHHHLQYPTASSSYVRNNTLPHKTNGDLTSHSLSASSEEQDVEEERQLIRDVLSRVAVPKVMDVGSRCALILLTPPNVGQTDVIDIDLTDVLFELHLSEKNGSLFNSVYNGDATEITLRDLKPATDYFIKVHSILESIIGSPSDVVNFTTLPCEPESPPPPKLVSKTISSLLLKWNAAVDNGSPITSYTLEYDKGAGDLTFEEAYTGPQRQHKITKLLPATSYSFRLFASNALGRSNHSRLASYSTSGMAPQQPDPPMLSESFADRLTVSWIRRPNDDVFTLMIMDCKDNDDDDDDDDGGDGGDGDDDEEKANAFSTIYNGPSLSHNVTRLRRNSEYKFKLQASNEDGSSDWSDVVKYRTTADKPGVCTKPHIIGDITHNSFTIAWDPPADNGGQDVINYLVMLDNGAETLVKDTKLIREYVADNLNPGCHCKLKVASVNAIGQSQWSEALTITTKPCPPEACSHLEVCGKMHNNNVVNVKWKPPNITNGSPVTTYELMMIEDNNNNNNNNNNTPSNSNHNNSNHSNHNNSSSSNNSSCNSLNNRSSRSNSNGRWMDVYKGSDTNCSLDNLVPGKSYLFRVRAFNSAGAGQWSDHTNYTSGPLPPSTPDAPLVTCISPHLASVKWCQPQCNGAEVVLYKLEWQQQDSEFNLVYSGVDLSTDVADLKAASLYSFRVQAVNAAGASPFSSTTTCITPPTHPGPITLVHASSTSNSITLIWREPTDHGSKITGYYVSIDDRPVSLVDSKDLLVGSGSNIEYCICGLLPETVYKIKVQAGNSIGLGPLSSCLKISTHSHPPPPPHLECVVIGYNNLKLKWRDAKIKRDSSGSCSSSCSGGGGGGGQITYCLEMLKDLDSFQKIYLGPAHCFRVNKLQELTDYRFRICSINREGQGEYSDLCIFKTSKSPPPVLKAPKVAYITSDACSVEWTSLRPMGQDTLYYILQLQSVFGRDQTFKEIYRGPSTTHRVVGLSPSSEYRLKVCGARQSKNQSTNQSEEVIGLFSQTTSFVTAPDKSANYKSTVDTVANATNKWTNSMFRFNCTDQQWAVILLICFALFAIFLAFVVQQFVSQQSGEIYDVISTSSSSSLSSSSSNSSSSTS